MNKRNCWEFKKCGREPGGSKVHELGECPAATDGSLDSVHDGKNAGRACWILAGTMCGGKVQGTFAKKYENCKICDFYKATKKEEGHDFMHSIVLMKKVQGA